MNAKALSFAVNKGISKDAPQLPKNGIILHWELAEKPVGDNPTYQDLTDMMT